MKMTNINNNRISKISQNNHTYTSKLSELYKALAICVLVISSLSAVQYAYATNPPEIISIIINDPDNLDDVYSANDIITITFDSDTNIPGGIDTQLTSAINDMFLFSDSIGIQYAGLWTDSDTFEITISDVTGANISMDITTVIPSGITLILSSDGTSAPSTVTSPVLSGDFGMPSLAEPELIPIITIDDKGYVGIITEEPISKLQVIDGYVQLDTVSGMPPTIDCDDSYEYGRMKVDDTANTSKLYVCTPTGWLVLIGTVINPDSDGDGIEDIVDPLPNDNTNDTFDDGDITSGSIMRGDQTIAVIDAIDSGDGVLVTADRLGGSTPATITDCDGANYILTSGDIVIITCSS